MAARGRSCRASREVLTDAQITALVNYLRATFTDNPPWRDVDRGGASNQTRRQIKSKERKQRTGDPMITLNVNGQSRQVDAEPDTPLLYVLRNDLALNGAKFGCGLGQCGSCTVLLDGNPVFSCVIPISVLENRRITTVEGLGTPEAPGPLQRAFIEENAAQCGYCIPGMMMRAQALLNANKDPVGSRNPPPPGAESVPLRNACAHRQGGADAPRKRCDRPRRSGADRT